LTDMNMGRGDTQRTCSDHGSSLKFDEPFIDRKKISLVGQVFATSSMWHGKTSSSGVK
jgi:hypothetical protein